MDKEQIDHYERIRYLQSELVIVRRQMKRVGNILLGLIIAGIAAAVFLAPWLMDDAELMAK